MRAIEGEVVSRKWQLDGDFWREGSNALAAFDHVRHFWTTQAQKMGCCFKDISVALEGFQSLSPTLISSAVVTFEQGDESLFETWGGSQPIAPNGV